MPSDSRVDASSSNNEANLLDNIFGTSPGASSLRERTDSESSDNMARFVLPSIDGSPPKVLSINELSHLMHDIQNMELAHEIAINPEFRLQPYEAPENSLERRIKETMHTVFWDLLREQLQNDPPKYEFALRLLGDIKSCFPQILTPKSQRTIQHVNEVLDEDVIRQQAEQGVLDFKSYATFIIDIMAKSCAPARDEAVQKLREIDDVVNTFRGILDTMTLMKIDMTNFVLDSARRSIINNSVEYEKKKFLEYLEYYQFGFPHTESWLQRNRSRDANNVPCSIDHAIANAYMELMDWDVEKEFPEVLANDYERILKYGQRAKRLCVCAALNIICNSVLFVAERAALQQQLAKDIEVLVRSVTSEKDIAEVIPSVWEHIKKTLNEELVKAERPILNEDAETKLKDTVLAVANKDSQLRTLMWKRLRTYFSLILRSVSPPPPPPPGFGSYLDELKAYANGLRHVISYNHSVFGDYFKEILNKQERANEAANTEELTASTSSAAAIDIPNVKASDSNITAKLNANAE